MPPLLEAVNVFLRPPGRSDREILKNINLKIRSGSLIVVRGASGSGKSKLLRLLSGRLKPSSGKVFFEGSDIYSFSRSGSLSFRRRSSFISSEDNFISSSSVYGNLEASASIGGIPSKVAFDRIMQVLKICGLIGIRDLLPEELSSGEKKLFKLALCLLMEPELILADLNLGCGRFASASMEILKNAASRGSAVVFSASDGTRLNLPPQVWVDMENGEIR